MFLLINIKSYQAAEVQKYSVLMTEYQVYGGLEDCDDNCEYVNVNAVVG